MTKLLTIAILLIAPAQASPWHCQRNGVAVHNCHICNKGSNWMTLHEYQCTAAQERRQMRDLELKNCSQKPLTEVPNGKFKDKCMDISRRSP